MDIELAIGDQRWWEKIMYHWQNKKKKITKIYPLKQAFEFRRMVLENQLLIRLEKCKWIFSPIFVIISIEVVPWSLTWITMDIMKTQKGKWISWCKIRKYKAIYHLHLSSSIFLSSFFFFFFLIFFSFRYIHKLCSWCFKAYMLVNCLKQRFS